MSVNGMQAHHRTAATVARISAEFARDIIEMAGLGHGHEQRFDPTRRFCGEFDTKSSKLRNF